MAKNTYYNYKKGRKDFKAVSEAAYVIQPHLDECITIRSVGTVMTKVMKYTIT